MQSQMWTLISLLAIALPWLNPFAPGPTPSVPGLIFAWSCAAVFLVGMGVATRTRGAGFATSVVAHAWLVAATLSALIGLVQYFGTVGNAWSPWVSNAPLGQAFGNLRQRNQFASLTSIGLVALLWQVSQWPHSLKSVPAHRRLGLLLIGFLLALGNAASTSRTGLLQCLGVWALCWMGSAPGQRRTLWVASGALLVYLCAVLALPLALEWATRVQGGLLVRLSEDAGCGSRRVLWANVLHLIAQKPWFGWGWGELDYAHFITLYPGERFCDLLDNAHNLPLHLAVELGLPAAVLLCALALWALLRARPWHGRDPGRQLAWDVLGVIFLHSLLEYPLWYGPFQVAAAWCVWHLWQTRGWHPDRSVSARRTLLTSRWTVAGVAATGLAFMAWVTVDYWRVSQLYLPVSARSSAYQSDTLAKLRKLRFFQEQVQFAELTTTPLDRHNAEQLHAMAQQVLHFSPEPQVVEKLLESAVLLNRDADALFYLQRYQAAYPEAHARWASRVNPATPRESVSPK
ncbi:MAG: Wzy polymerase domain-containing protein [Rhodoferax sp.]|nr:Wzy polymerase domain-containing protein [Rhodoferax sp.]MCF8210579.1 Wzy polymerase domain-containing protein [Rhodoferax sp.]